MDTDLILTAGLLFAALSVPMLLAAFVEGRLPRAGILLLVLAGGLIGYALYTSPKTITLHDIPMIVLSVVARALN